MPVIGSIVRPLGRVGVGADYVSAGIALTVLAAVESAGEINVSSKILCACIVALTGGCIPVSGGITAQSGRVGMHVLIGVFAAAEDLVNEITAGKAKDRHQSTKKQKYTSFHLGIPPFKKFYFNYIKYKEIRK